MQALNETALINGRYRVMRVLGEGDSGRVYEALDTRLHTPVALKQLTRASERRNRAFEREAHILARLRHPGLPAVTDFFTDADGRFLVMEYVPGIDLAALIEERGAAIGVWEALPIAEQLIQTLEYLHGQHPPVLHRAIKPNDIKLTPAGRVVLLDFGLASDLPHSAATGGPTTLNPYSPALWYAPPELLYRRDLDARSDLYALGATLYFILTCVRPPATGLRASALIDGRGDPLRPAHELNPTLDDDLSALLSQTMALNPNDRPSDATMVRVALRATRAGMALWGAPSGVHPVPRSSATSLPQSVAPQPANPSAPLLTEGTGRATLIALVLLIILVAVLVVSVMLLASRLMG